jgi:hypothetical protein
MKCAEMPFPIQAVVHLDQQQVAPLGLLKKNVAHTYIAASDEADHLATGA